MQYTISNLSENMSAQEIQDAWVDIREAWETLRTACENQLEELGYDEDTYEEGNDEVLDEILAIWDNLENVSF